MENAKYDENRGISMLCVDDSFNLLNAVVDPISNEVLMDILVENYSTTIIPEKIDENRQNVAIFVTDDANETITPAMINPNNNRLLVDLEIN
jgi:hypothetical protein